MTTLSRSDVGDDHAEARQQTKHSGPNKPLQHWLVGQKWYQGAGQEIDRPDCNLGRMNRGQSYFFRIHIGPLEKSPDRHRKEVMRVGARATQNLRRTVTVGLDD